MDPTRRARGLRRTSTEAERLLWMHVRNRALGGYKFRRQVPIGPYVADFVCISEGLVIELDGSQHHEQTDDDRQRTQWIESAGYRVLRLWNNDIFQNMHTVLEAIMAELQRTNDRDC
ncbi:MAG: endonuclease domain-containing protein [Chloroflexota bacterium]|nr:endonuclease domain-containing protein [Chloroflexota bacterium]